MSKLKIENGKLQIDVRFSGLLHDFQFSIFNLFSGGIILK